MRPKDQSRRELENAWRERVQRAAAKHKAESENLEDVFAELLAAPKASYGPDGLLSLQQARHRETAALKEYQRVLRILTDLLTKGTVPGEEPDSK